MLPNKKTHIVKTSKNKFYKFYIASDDLIVEEFSNGEVTQKCLFKEKILDYALDIDADNKIHIIYISYDKVLNYTIYPSVDEDMNIVTIKDKFCVDTLDIKVINSNIHIFYKTNNLYKDTSLLCHYSFCNNNCTDEDAIEILCPKYIRPYYIDTHKDDVYLLYCNNYTTHEYKIRRITSDTKCNNSETAFTLSNANNLNFFITPDNTGVISYNKSINRNFQTLIRYKNFSSLTSKWSEDIIISDNNVNSFKPIIFYNKKTIYIMWSQGSNIIYKTSNDLVSWSKEHILDTHQNSASIYSYVSNKSTPSDFKVNCMYVSCVKALCKIIISRYKHKTKSKNRNFELASVTPYPYQLPNSSYSGELTASKPYELQFIENFKDEISSESDVDIDEELFEEIFDNKNYIIDDVNSINDYLLNQINHLKNQLNEYEQTIEKLKKENIQNSHKLNNHIKYYENKISSLNSKVNTSLIYKNKTVHSLLKIIEDKESTIQNLYDFFNK